MVDTLESAHAFGLRVRPRVSKGAELATTIDFDPHHAAMERIVDAWLPLTIAMNSINRSMGQPDLYPFVLSPAVVGQARLHPRPHPHPRLGEARDRQAPAARHGRPIQAQDGRLTPDLTRRVGAWLRHGPVHTISAQRAAEDRDRELRPAGRITHGTTCARS